MTNVMNKIEFCKCLEVLKQYAAWENNLYNNGIDLACTPCCFVVDRLQAAMCGFNLDWSFDTKLEIDWISEWTFGGVVADYRHGIDWQLDTAEDLYDFLVYMNTHGWED